MTVSDHESIDMIARDKASKTIILGITDHLDWVHPQQHIGQLSKKLDMYLQYVANGEARETFQEYMYGDPFEIRIAFQSSLPDVR